MSKQKFLNKYLKFEEQLNRLTILYILDYFKCAGLDIIKKTYTKNDIKTVLMAHDKYTKFLNYVLYVLEQKNIIIEQNGKIHFLASNDIDENILKLNSDLENKFPEFINILKFVTHCAKNYKDVISGDISGVGVVYPSADINFVQPVALIIEKIYGIEYQRRILTKLLRSMSANEKISIIEVGAGVGLMTWKIVSKLNAGNINYHFTDISRFFLVKAKEAAKKRNIDFMDFESLDISRDPEAQGFQPRSFDFMLALNVIHATPNLLDTLHNLKKLLRPGGAIFIVEHATLPIWANLSWGILEGWWSFDDPARKLLPTLEQNDWKSLLEEAGFSSIRVFPKPNKQINMSLSYIGLLGIVE